MVAWELSKRRKRDRRLSPYLILVDVVVLHRDVLVQVVLVRLVHRDLLRLLVLLRVHLADLDARLNHHRLVHVVLIVI